MSAVSPLSSSSPTVSAGQLSVSNFAQTGLPGLNGGYAYPPGSEMAMFLDNVNKTTAQASLSPDGTQNILTWANGLAQSAAARAAASGSTAGATGTTGTTDTGTTAANSLSQLLSMLMSLLNQGSTDGTASTTPSMSDLTKGIYTYYNS